MKYEYDDIVRLRLPDARMIEFFDLFTRAAGQKGINPKFNIDTWIEINGTYAKGMADSLTRAEGNDYKNRPGYLLSSCNRDRALAAMQGPTETYKQNVLDLWLSVVNKMSPVEKALEGGDKI
jgi:hypothetical protein